MPAKKKTTPKKSTAKKDTAKKSTVKKTATQKAPGKKTAPAKKTASKKASANKPAAAEKGQSAFERFKPYQAKRGEPYMSDGQKEHFRALLQAWKYDLMEEVDRTVHHMQDEAANFPDPNDRATQESEFSLELRTRDRERKLIKKINQSIKLIDEDEYGFCETCGVEIGIRRLEARPTATQCIDCKTLDEIREKQMKG